MLKKFFTILIIFALSFILLPMQNIETLEIDLTVSKLLNNPQKYNGKRIVFIGEVIGEPLGRGDYRWINVSDSEGNAIGVWLKVELLKDIKYYGKYNIKGDTVEIEGIYHSICNEHGGDTDIHSDFLRVLKKGYLIKERVNLKRIYTVLILGVATLIVLLSIRIKKYYESLSK